MKGRYLSINTVIRKYQMETTRTEHLLEDETELHDVQTVLDFSDAVRKGFASAKITWAWSWQALVDRSVRYQTMREAMRMLHERYGDEVTFNPGTYFANVYNSRAQVNEDIAEALGLIEQFMGGYRPTSLVAGFLSSENIRYAREQHGINTVQGNIWSQYSVDAQDGEALSLTLIIPLPSTSANQRRARRIS